MSDHKDLHSEQGGLPGEHPGRHPDPVVKVRGLAWLELTKPDLDAAERFARHFGFTATLRTPDELHLRGTRPGPPCVLVRQGVTSRLTGVAFQAADSGDLHRLARRTGSSVQALPAPLGGSGVRLRDPGGLPVTVVAGTLEHAALAAQQPLPVNTGGELHRANAPQRPPREPARIERLGHVVLQSDRYRATLDWYLEHLGMVVSDFLFYEGQRDRGPTMSFLRCDLGSEPADHHTLALALGPTNRYVHSAYQVADLDAMAAGGEHLLEQGYDRSWGLGRHVQGSQLFDYWRDPDGLLVEHFSDGDRFDAGVEPGWEAMRASGLAQWGPPASRDFLGLGLRRSTLTEVAGGLRSLLDPRTEFDLRRLRGLLEVASS